MTAKPVGTSDWAPWRKRLHDIIFEADTAAGKAFDVALLIVIGLSLVAAMLDSVPSVRERHHDALVTAEWIFTVLFTIEYVLRLISVRRKAGYVLSFFGVIDLAAVLPTYLALLDLGWQHAAVLRALRLLRVFRVFKLARFLSEASALRTAIWASRQKVTVFLATVLIIVCIVGAAMYLIEGSASGFTSIPEGIYWAIVTVTTVGYGDISPVTPLGKALAALVMLVGYSLLIIPGGIISAEWVATSRRGVSTRTCPDCSREGHDPDARNCKWCGGKL